MGLLDGYEMELLSTFGESLEADLSEMPSLTVAIDFLSDCIGFCLSTPLSETLSSELAMGGDFWSF